MKLKPTRASLGILAGIVAVVVLVFGGLIWLQQSALADSKKLLEQKEQELADGEAVAKRLEQVRSSLDEDRSRVEILESQVAETAYIPTLLKQLEDLALRTTNRVIGVRPIVVVQAPTRLQQRRDPEAQAKADGKEPPDEKSKEEAEKKKKEAEPYTKQGIQVTLVGTYGSTQLMAEQLTRFPKILSVDEVQIRPHKPSSHEKVSRDTNLLDVEMKLTAYILKQRAAAPPADDKAKGGQS